MIPSTSRGAGTTIVPVTPQRLAIVGMIGSTRGRPWSSASFSRNDFFVFMSSPSAISGRTTQRLMPLFPAGQPCGTICRITSFPGSSRKPGCPGSLSTCSAIPLEQPREAGEQGCFDLRAALEPAERERRRLQRREAFAARLAAELAVERRPARPQHQPLPLQHPRVAPPQCLSLAPGAVEDDDALDVG